jgi:hypothetical protein
MEHQPAGSQAAHRHAMHGSSPMAPYRRLAVSLALSYVIMYASMYARVVTFDHAYLSLNQAYMAGLMVAPMLLVMLATMSHMFAKHGLNIALALLGLALIALFLFMIRTQAAVGDVQFLRSMIPHHSGAILVCRNASLRDARAVELCKGIIESQEREIREMKALLGE